MRLGSTLIRTSPLLAERHPKPQYDCLLATGFAQTMVFDFLPPKDHGLTHAVKDHPKTNPKTTTLAVLLEGLFKKNRLNLNICNPRTPLGWGVWLVVDVQAMTLERATSRSQLISFIERSIDATTSAPPLSQTPVHNQK
jgi:hypothetical protein